VLKGSHECEIRINCVCVICCYDVRDFPGLFDDYQTGALDPVLPLNGRRIRIVFEPIIAPLRGEEREGIQSGT
jgi:hypothetical protein